MVEKTIIRDPSAILDYDFNWAGDTTHESWLQDTETISSHVVTVDAGITKDSSTEDAGTVTIWLSGGTAEQNYIVACKITTNMGRTDERSILIRCEDR